MSRKTGAATWGVAGCPIGMNRSALVALALSLCCANEPRPQQATAAEDTSTQAVSVPAHSQFDAAMAPRTSSVGFRLPSPSTKRRAIGVLDRASATELVAYQSLEDFSDISFPEEGDWLDTYFESGQTFDGYVRSSTVNRLSDYRNTLYLQPIGRIGSSSGPSLAELGRFVQTFFQVPVKSLPALTIDDVKQGQRERSTGKQLLVRTIFAAMRPRVPKRAFAVLALTGSDLYPGKDWNYVFGQATLRERIGVQSLSRYFPSFYGASDEGSAKLIRRRAYKVLAHEIGHMFGLEHCTYFQCVMNGINSMEEADRSPLHLCPVCLRKLQLNTRFDLVKRYKALARELRQHGLRDEAAWHLARAKKIAVTED